MASSSSSSWGLGGDHHGAIVAASAGNKRSSCCEISIFWDYENVPLPSWCNAAVAAKAIVNAVSSYGRIVDRRLYYDFEKQTLSSTKSPSTTSSTSQQQYLDSSGFNLVNTPSRHNNNTSNNTTTTLDKKLIPDLLTFAWDAAVRNNNNGNNKTAIVLLTSDGDYAYTLSKLRDRGVMTIVIVGTEGPVSNHILADVADVALSLQDDVLRPEQEKRNISISSLPSLATTTTTSSTTTLGARGMGTSATNTLPTATFAGGVDSSVMDIFLTSFCRLIHDRIQKDHAHSPWQNYASVSELLQRIIRQKMPPSTSSDIVKELTKQIRLQACSVNLIQVGRRCIHDNSNSNNSGISSVVGEIIPSTHANYNTSKLSLEVYVGLLPRGQAVALGHESVNKNSHHHPAATTTSGGGGDVASSTTSSSSNNNKNNKGSSANSNNSNKKIIVDTESLVLELCRVIQQKAASSADAWVDLGQVLARIQHIIRQRNKHNSYSISNSKKGNSAAMKDHDVKEMARSTREVAATRGLIAIGKRRLEKNSSGEEQHQQREIIALSKNTRHLTLSGESYVCLLPKGEMLLASPPSTSTSTVPAPTLGEEQEQEREEPMSISSPSSSSLNDSDLSLALCRIIRQRAITVEGGEFAWVDLGETMSQLQQMMRGNNASSSTDDVKDKARAVRLHAVARGLLESGRRVLAGKKGNNDNDNLNSEKEIVVINKDTKYYNLSLGEYYLRLLPQGNALVTSDSSCEALTPSSTTLLLASSPQTPSRGVKSGHGSDFVSLAKAVQQYSSQKDGWAGLGSVLSQFQKSLRKGSHSPYSSSGGSGGTNQEEIKNQARSLREQAVDEGIIEMGRRRLDRTDLDGEREIVVVSENSNTSHPLDRNLSTESYVRLLFKGESLLKNGKTLTVATTTVSYKAALETPAPPPPPPPPSNAIKETPTEAQLSISTLVFIRNLPPETQIRELVRFLEDSFSITIIRARIRNGQFSTMVAHIEVSSESQATKLIEKSKNQTTGGQGLYYHNRKIMIFPETLKSSLDVRGDDSMYYQKVMPTTSLSSTPPTLAETTLSHTFDEATEMDTAPELACIVLCRNCPRVTHVLDLVRFLQNTFPVTVCRALIEVADATSSNAHVELLHASEAAMLIEQASGGNGMVFRNRRISVFPSSSTIELDTKGDDTMYYDGDDVGECGTLTQTDSFIDAAADRLVQAHPGTTYPSQTLSDHFMPFSSITQTASFITAPPGLCIQPGASIPTAPSSPDVAWLCLTLLSQENKPGLDPNGWIYGANIGAPFRSLLPREYTQTASKDEMSARFKNARTMAVEGGYIEVGRRRQDENDIVTVPLSSFGQNPTDQNFTLDVFFRLLVPGRSLALETKKTARPINDEFPYCEGNKKTPFSKYLFMNNLPLSTSSEELSGFLESNFTCAVKGIRLKENTWEGSQVQSGHVELDSIAEAVEILRVAKTPPGLLYCGNFIYTVIDAFPPEPVEHVAQPLKLRDFIR